MSGWREHTGSSATRGYDTEWRRLRDIVMAEEPTCRACGQSSQEVDHILPVSQRPDLRRERTNLQALCARCHHRKTGREHGRRAGQRTAERHPGYVE